MDHWVKHLKFFYANLSQLVEKQPKPKIIFKYLPNSKKNLVLEKHSSRVFGFLSRVSRFKQGGPKLKQGAPPCLSNMGRTLVLQLLILE
jgi:hypothetical protein